MALLFVTFTGLRGESIQVNSADAELAELTAVPSGSLPTGVANGTNIDFDDGRRIQVQGTPAATAAALTANGPDPSAATYIPNPPLPLNANSDALTLKNVPIVPWEPTANRKFDPRTAVNSMGMTFIKSNALAFSITIDVTTGGNQGWTTPGGLNTDYVLFGSGNAAAGSWLIMIDLPRKIVYATPVS